MSFLRDTRLTSFLDKSQDECAPKWMRVLGMVVLIVLSVLAIAALVAVALDAPASLFERIWYVMLVALILWYDVGFCKKFLKRTKRNGR